jgi:hypothetical protein
LYQTDIYSVQNLIDTATEITVFSFMQLHAALADKAANPA